MLSFWILLCPAVLHTDKAIHWSNTLYVPEVDLQMVMQNNTQVYSWTWGAQWEQNSWNCFDKDIPVSYMNDKIISKMNCYMLGEIADFINFYIWFLKAYKKSCLVSSSGSNYIWKALKQIEVFDFGYYILDFWKLHSELR